MCELRFQFCFHKFIPAACTSQLNTSKLKFAKSRVMCCDGYISMMYDRMPGLFEIHSSSKKIELLPNNNLDPIVTCHSCPLWRTRLYRVFYLQMICYDGVGGRIAYTRCITTHQIVRWSFLKSQICYTSFCFRFEGRTALLFVICWCCPTSQALAGHHHLNTNHSCWTCKTHLKPVWYNSLFWQLIKRYLKGMQAVVKFKKVSIFSNVRLG